MSKRVIVLRATQLLLVLVCLLREVINALTDIGQYQRLFNMTQTIYAFPTLANVHALFDRSIHNAALAHINVLLLIVAHVLVATLLFCGLIVLLKVINSTDFKLYQRQKTLCVIGLSLGLVQYFLIYGCFAMDYFLSWMQQIDFHADVVGYGLPLAVALLYLCLVDFKEAA